MGTVYDKFPSHEFIDMPRIWWNNFVGQILNDRKLTSATKDTECSLHRS
jgi:hypothetical protein